MLLGYFFNDCGMVPLAHIIYYCYHFGFSFQTLCVLIVQYIIIIVIVIVIIISIIIIIIIIAPPAI